MATAFTGAGAGAVGIDAERAARGDPLVFRRALAAGFAVFRACGVGAGAALRLAEARVAGFTSEGVATSEDSLARTRGLADVFRGPSVSAAADGRASDARRRDRVGAASGSRRWPPRGRSFASDFFVLFIVWRNAENAETNDDGIRV